MSITSTHSEQANELILKVGNRFDFNMHKAFRKAYEKINGPVERYVIDLKDTDYMDSSALGMLLMLREYAGGDKSNIRIINGHDNIKNILSISNFDNLFDIE